MHGCLQRAPDITSNKPVEFSKSHIGSIAAVITSTCFLPLSRNSRSRYLLRGFIMGFANSVSVLGFDLRAGESLVHFFHFSVRSMPLFWNLIFLTITWSISNSIKSTNADHSNSHDGPMLYIGGDCLMLLWVIYWMKFALIANDNWINNTSLWLDSAECEDEILFIQWLLNTLHCWKKVFYISVMVKVKEWTVYIYIYIH